jgi:Cu/Ag efflux protein CusF
MKQARRLFTVTAALALFAAVCLGQAAPKKTYTFRGKVEAINEKAKSLTVNGDEVPGWMGAMTMDYQVDDPAVLKKVKVGDQISSTVYDGDYVLHKVQVVPKAAAGDKKSKK